jgi:hypothetical protein
MGNNGTAHSVKIYFDTSAICRLSDSEKSLQPEIASLSAILRQIAESANYTPVISPMVWAEISDASEEKAAQAIGIISEFNFTDLLYHGKIEPLINAYAVHQVLTQKHYYDLVHIAYATIGECQYLVSCDTRHIARQGTQLKVAAVNQHFRYQTPLIVTPAQLLEKIK